MQRFDQMGNVPAKLKKWYRDRDLRADLRGKLTAARAKTFQAWLKLKAKA